MVGDGVGALGSATLQLAQSNQILRTSAVSINSDGKFDVNGKTQTIGSLSMTGGIVDVNGASYLRS